MIHSFYYVGCLIKEKKQLEAERREKQLLCKTVNLFNRISQSCQKSDFGFWPKAVAAKISKTRVPDLASIPRPSYELIDDEEDQLMKKPVHSKPPLVVFPLQDWNSKSVELMPRVFDLDEVQEDKMTAPTCKKSSIFEGICSLMRHLVELVVPYPVLHPWRVLEALYGAFHREIRLHLKNNDDYFARRGMWLRTFLNLPCFIIERRSALRFRFKTITPK
eukprot:g8498.t1